MPGTGIPGVKNVVIPTLERVVEEVDFGVAGHVNEEDPHPQYLKEADLTQSIQHEQAVPDTVWAFTHNLGFIPAGILATQYDGTIIEGEVTWLDETDIELTFSAAISGFLYLS